jgi:hypothetical protein
MKALSYLKIDEYFQDLATKHVDIEDYCGTSINELANKIGTPEGVKSPILILFNIQNKLTGNQQRTMNNRTISFTIAFARVDPNDYQAQKQAIDDAGGWEGDTLTEDMDLSYRAQLNGWRMKFVYDVIVPAIREVRYLSDSTFDMRWWTYPDTSVTVNVTDTLRYVMPLHWHNTSCGVQDTWHIYDVTGIFRNDTLFETGTLEYKFYYYGELKQHFFGTFTAYSMFERKLRP